MFETQGGTQNRDLHIKGSAGNLSFDHWTVLGCRESSNGWLVTCNTGFLYM